MLNSFSCPLLSNGTATFWYPSAHEKVLPHCTLKWCFVFGTATGEARSTETGTVLTNHTQQVSAHTEVYPYLPNDVFWAAHKHVIFILWITKSSEYNLLVLFIQQNHKLYILCCLILQFLQQLGCDYSQMVKVECVHKWVTSTAYRKTFITIAVRLGNTHIWLFCAVPTVIHEILSISQHSLLPPN